MTAQGPDLGVRSTGKELSLGIGQRVCACRFRNIGEALMGEDGESRDGNAVWADTAGWVVW